MTKAEIQALIDSNLADLSNIVPSKHREVHQEIANNTFLLYEVKYLHCPQSFIDDNFDGTGLGNTELMNGWAICNGNNGTENADGKVLIGYGSTYNTMLATGGEAEHLLTAAESGVNEHDHSFAGSGVASGFLGLDIGANQNLQNLGSTFVPPITNTVSGGSKPADEAHNNMQPYIVTLMIQRIA